MPEGLIIDRVGEGVLMSEGILSFIGTWFCILEVMWLVKKITGGLMVRVLLSGSSRPGQNPGKGQCLVLLGKTLYFHSASLTIQVNVF